MRRRGRKGIKCNRRAEEEDVERNGEEQAFATRVSGCMLASSIQREGEEAADKQKEEEEKEQEARIA